MAKGRGVWRTVLPQFKSTHAEATDRALIASAQVLVNAVKRGLRGGYTTGAFTRGDSINAVQWMFPVTEDGVRVIRVGTPLMYNLYWELGHNSRWTGKYERVEVWRPAAEETADAQAKTFATVYIRTMQKLKGV